MSDLETIYENMLNPDRDPVHNSMYAEKPASEFKKSVSFDDPAKLETLEQIKSIEDHINKATAIVAHVPDTHINDGVLQHLSEVKRLLNLIKKKNI